MSTPSSTVARPDGGAGTPQGTRAGRTCPMISRRRPGAYCCAAAAMCCSTTAIAAAHVAALDRVDDRGVPVPRHHRRRCPADSQFMIVTRMRPSRWRHASTSIELPDSWHSSRWKPRSASSFAAKSPSLSASWDSASRSVATAASRSRRGDDLRDGEPLQRRAHAEQLADLLRGDRADPQHAAVARGDQPLLLEVAQRLAHRAAADPEVAGQLHLAEVVARAGTARR